MVQKRLLISNDLIMKCLLLFFVFILSFSLFANNKYKGYKYYIGNVSKNKVALPEGKSIPFDWEVGEIGSQGDELLIKWENKIEVTNKNVSFRITSATDVRENCVLQLSTPVSKTVIGVIDIRYSHYMQPYQFDLTIEQFKLINSEGLVLKMIKGTKPFWFFVSNELKTDVPDVFLPHLMVSDAKKNTLAWKEQLNSFGSLSSFGWMEGIVMDGLSSVGNNKELVKHFDKFRVNNQLVYEAYNNQRLVDSIFTVEAILPFAFLNSNQFNESLKQKAIDFCNKHADECGVIADDFGNDRILKTEECYTIAYPLALLAKTKNNPKFASMAIANLNARSKLLHSKDFIYQKSTENGIKIYGNWARGMGWYLLGLAKSLAILPKNQETLKLRAAFQEGANLVMQYQQSNGLWFCFVHQPETGIETSGSAAIAAALAYGYSKGLLPKACNQAAQRGYNGLTHYFTADGFLTNTVQVNKGGEGLQRNGYRVISPYTLGLIGILYSSLN